MSLTLAVFSSNLTNSVKQKIVGLAIKKRNHVVKLTVLLKFRFEAVKCISVRQNKKHLHLS